MSQITPPPPPSASALRQLCRIADQATLATIAHDHKQVTDGWPVTSMVVPVIDIDGTPLLLISDLADHTRHIRADNRVSLLFSPTPFARSQHQQAGAIQTDSARLTLFGKAVADPAPHTRARYLREQPDAGQYADFADFAFYRIAVDAIYWVGGFGKQRRLKGDQFIVPDCHPLVTGHDGIVSHMNADHLDAIADIVAHFTSHDPTVGWKMHSIDCDGMVLAGHKPEQPPIRIDFARTIHSPGEARDILVEMCKKSRA
ncbi:DUF2470 domain-containing protein [uncultured Thalassospira sp.]|uniref:HugZ family pyridoxamine 5'-phosphate oxidase n=1 Tax=uncultured Thalassospira sp. TaxID=404382 RepID=UPI002599CCCE|nr:DUF2470 domain-containing protein [uncultured Thalassospira sp.]